MLKNNVQLKSSEIFAIFDGKKDNFINNISENWFCKGISSDTRDIDKGNLFVALKGEIYDAHDKINEAFEKGAAACIVNADWYLEHKNEYIDSSLIVVQDTLSALGQLGAYHRNKFNIPVIAIGGSNGKTTTKEITAHLLSQQLKTLKTYANFNNKIGVPHMLFQMDETYQAAVIEIGTNEPGEIAYLSNILSPTLGLITNIGEEHLEKLGDILGVELEETYLFGHLLKNDAPALLNMDDPILAKYSSLLEKKIAYGSGENADFRITYTLDDQLHPELTFTYGEEEVNVKMQSTGLASALNSIAAISVAGAVGISKEKLIKGLETYKTDDTHQYGRMLLEELHGKKIINDCYNANPPSMRLALDTIQAMKTEGKKFAVLGDMYELGDNAIEMHIEIIEKAKASADYVFIVGELMKEACHKTEDKSKMTCFNNKEDLIKQLKENSNEGDIILVKGSRGMKMEEIIMALK